MDGFQFSKEELQRYSRHLVLPEFNIRGQRKLKKSKVLVVGAGGLGCPMLLYLTAAGVGTIGIIDFDVVDVSNLQRQVLFTEDDVGKSKAKVAIQKLSRLNPHIKFRLYETKLTSRNAMDILKDYDVVADGTDNFPTRYLVNDACVLLNKTNVHGSIFRFEGQVSVFNFQYEDGSTGPQYRDIFPTPPPPGLVPNCAEGGVLGVLPGIIGSFQASEVIKVLTGVGAPLAGKLFVFDALSFETRIMKISKNPDVQPITELIDYEDFCGVLNSDDIPEITAKALHALLKNQSGQVRIIDVREPHEFEAGNLGGILLPLGTLGDRLHEISSAEKNIVICRSGTRSGKAVKMLVSRGFENVFNLKGGLLKWAEEIDRSMVVV